MLNIESTNVFYGDLQAIYDISFQVNEGETVVIVGSNGAGKTTTLRTISGLMHPQSGSITFYNERIDHMPPHEIVERGIAQIPEGRHLWPYMTVLENLETGAYLPKARTNMEESLQWVFELFPRLKERKNQLAGTLSGGEQQMLAVGRGLMSRPKLMMLDEPSLGLAPKLMLTVFDIVQTINEQDVTILLVEQNVRHALTLADRGYVLETGRIVLEGSGEELIENDHVKRSYLGM